MGRGLLTLHLDGLLGLGDLLLADLEQDLGGPQLVVGVGLLPYDDVATLLGPGEVRGVLGAHHRGQRLQVRVLGLVHRGDHLGHRFLLHGEVRAPRLELRLRLLEPGPGLLQLERHLAVALPGGVEGDLGRLQLGAGRVERLLGGVERRHRATHPRTGVVQVVVGVLDAVLDALATVLEVVGVRERNAHGAHRECCRREGGEHAVTGGTGEETHRAAFGSGKSCASNVTEPGQTLRYLRVSTSVGSSVSTGPSTATAVTA